MYVRNIACASSSFDRKSRSGPGKTIQAYWKHDNNVCLTLNHYRQVVPDFKSFESFVDEDILDLRGRDETCRRGTEVGRGRG